MERPFRIYHVVHEQHRAIWQRCSRNGERAVNVSRLLAAVGHRLLLRTVVGLLYYTIKRQIQRGGKPARKVWHQVWMPPRRNARHPSWRRLRRPLPNEIRTGVYKIVGKAAIPILSITHKLAPARITPHA